MALRGQSSLLSPAPRSLCLLLLGWLQIRRGIGANRCTNTGMPEITSDAVLAAMHVRTERESQGERVRCPAPTSQGIDAACLKAATLHSQIRPIITGVFGGAERAGPRQAAEMPARAGSDGLKAPPVRRGPGLPAD